MQENDTSAVETNPSPLVGEGGAQAGGLGGRGDERDSASIQAHHPAPPSPSHSAPPSGSLPPPQGGRGESERTCILSGRKDARDALIRLALGPDGQVAPDIRAKAPGRGAWIGVDRTTLEQAIAKGWLAKALARAFKQAVKVPADLADQIERALERAALDRLGLEARAGQLLTGSEKIAEAARKGTVALLLHASDAAADGNRRLDQALRVGTDQEGSGVGGMVIPATRAILSMALGRENVVHIGLIAPAAAARVNQALGRWRGFIGLDG